MHPGTTIISDHRESHPDEPPSHPARALSARSTAVSTDDPTPPDAPVTPDAAMAAETPGPADAQEAAGGPGTADAPAAAGGASKPWRDQAPNPKHTAKIVKRASALAETEPKGEWDKAAAAALDGPVEARHLRVAIGVDVGGSGIKAAAVNLDTGELLGLRHRVPTPMPSAPAAVIASIARLVKKITAEVELGDRVPVGVGFPAIVIDGVTKSAANVDPGWVDFDADTAMERVLGRPVHLVNDADAAGVAEMRFGAGVGQAGTVFLITLGTGTGSALFYNGMLVPNLELGHMEIRGRDAERRSAAVARLKRSLSWSAWAMDLDEHLLAIERLFSPKLFIIGGGVSKRSERFIPRLTVRAAVVPAQLLNDAGIVGAAMAASETEDAKPPTA
jgi:polyphosphate glucokinase